MNATDMLVYTALPQRVGLGLRLALFGLLHFSTRSYQEVESSMSLPAQEIL